MVVHLYCQFDSICKRLGKAPQGVSGMVFTGGLAEGGRSTLSVVGPITWLEVAE